MVPTLTWGLVRSNFSFAIANSPKEHACVGFNVCTRLLHRPAQDNRAAPDRRLQKYFANFVAASAYWISVGSLFD
jgi:hypothetical protein